MKIELNYQNVEYYISVTESTYDVYKLGKNTNPESKNFGNTTEVSLGYFKNLSNAIEKIIRSGMESTDETVSLKEYIYRFEKAREELIALLD